MLGWGVRGYRQQEVATVDVANKTIAVQRTRVWASALSATYSAADVQRVLVQQLEGEGQVFYHASAKLLGEAKPIQLTGFCKDRPPADAAAVAFLAMVGRSDLRVEYIPDPDLV